MSCPPSPTATARLKPSHDAKTRPPGRSPDLSANARFTRESTLMDRTFPHLSMQWFTAILC